MTIKDIPENMSVSFRGHNEAPAIFKKDGTYWMITSGCTGWAPNAARLFSAPSIWGPWKQHPNPCQGEEVSGLSAVKALTFAASRQPLPFHGRYLAAQEPNVFGISLDSGPV